MSSISLLTEISSDNKRKAAVRLAEEGFRVFPLQANGNTPITEGWQKTATSDPIKAGELFTDVLGDPAPYNIGIAAGEGLLILDFDVKNGKPGKKSFDTLNLMGMPDATLVTTPSGGMHLYLESDQDFVNSIERVMDGVDVRSKGGYVVAPGSEINGKEYKLERYEKHPAPEWLEKLCKKAKPKSEAPPPQIELDQTFNITQAIHYLRTAAPEAVEGSGGDFTTFQVAAKVRDFGVSQQQAFALISEYWNETGKASPPWDPEDLQIKIENAYQYAQNHIGAQTAQAEFEPIQIEQQPKDTRKPLGLNPVKPVEPQAVKPREWILGNVLARRYMNVTVSPPGVGKTTFWLQAAVAIATGRDDMTPFQVHERTHTLYFNQEDDNNELNLRLLAIMQHFNVTWDDLFLDGKCLLTLASGVERPLNIATHDRKGGLSPSRDALEIQNYLKENQIGAAIFDPFVELHPADENDNGQISQVSRIFRRIGVNANCAISVIHHTRKRQSSDATGHAGNMDSGRGAGSLMGAARMVTTMYEMDEAEAKKRGVPEEKRRYYVRFDDGKNNLAIIGGEPVFLKREGVVIDGLAKAGNGKESEEVGVLIPKVLGKVEDAEASLMEHVRERMDRDLKELLEANKEALVRGVPVRDMVSGWQETDIIFEGQEAETLAKAIKRNCTKANTNTKEEWDVIRRFEVRNMRGPDSGRRVAAIALKKGSD